MLMVSYFLPIQIYLTYIVLKSQRWEIIVLQLLPKNPWSYHFLAYGAVFPYQNLFCNHWTFKWPHHQICLLKQLIRAYQNLFHVILRCHSKIWIIRCRSEFITLKNDVKHFRVKRKSKVPVMTKKTNVDNSLNMGSSHSY